MTDATDSDLRDALRRVDLFLRKYALEVSMSRAPTGGEALTVAMVVKSPEGQPMEGRRDFADFEQAVFGLAETCDAIEARRSREEQK